MLRTLNMKLLLDLDKRIKSAEGSFAEQPFFQPVPPQQVRCSLPSPQPQQQRAQTTRRLPAGRTARSRRFVVYPGDARTGLSAVTVGRGHTARRRDETVAAGMVPLDYEITRRSHAACSALLNPSRSLKLSGTTHRGHRTRQGSRT